MRPHPLGPSSIQIGLSGEFKLGDLMTSVSAPGDAFVTAEGAPGLSGGLRLDPREGIDLFRPGEGVLHRLC